MTLILGALLAGGLLLTVSPFVWPAPASTRARRDWMQPYRQRLTLAGLGGVSPTLVVIVSALLGLAAGALVLALIGVLALAVAVAIVSAVAPSVAIGWRARSRRRSNRVMWPDVVDQLVSAVRSGLALPDSVVSLGHTGPALSRTSFASFEASYRATGNFVLCLDELKSALADPVADRIIETLRMSREVGGTELTTVLRNLSADLRQESAIRAEVEARQSWVLNAAKLGVAAPWVVLLLLATRPEAAAAYNSVAGTTLIVVGLAVSFVAYRLMIGLGRLPEERRWFV